MWFSDDDDYVVGSGAPQIMVERIGSGARLGVNVHALEDGLGSYFGTETGVLVLSVLEDSAAEKAGLRTGDVILKVDDEDVTDTVELHEVLGEFEPGDEVALSIMREKSEQTIDVELGEDSGLHFVREMRGPNGPGQDRKSTRLNSSHTDISRMPSSA